jgi:hypothetical protein
MQNIATITFHIIATYPPHHISRSRVLSYAVARAVERVASPCVSLHFQSPYFIGPVFALIVFYHIRIAFWRCTVYFPAGTQK